MNGKLYGLTGVAIWLIASVVPSTDIRPFGVAQTHSVASTRLLAHKPTRYTQTLRYNIYSFSIDAPDSGIVRELTIKAHRGQLLLTNFRVRIEGAVAGAQVADLDKNRYPELYVYSSTSGGGSYGRVYGWQFLPERKADVMVVNWRLSPERGYMGRDSLWIERDVLCRQYPVFRPGDDETEPTGGNRIVRYRLRSVGPGFALVAERE